ncbi:hypothetical protein BJH93_04030 [Kocuria polaris]|nr:hypothetical protein [Kocuria polaris]
MKLETIQIEKIRANAANIRTVADDEHIEVLAGDIKAMGVQNPLRVYPDPDVQGDYRLQDGHRRRLAAIRAGLSAVPCVVVDEPATHELGDLDVMLTTGRNHKLLTVAEEAQAFQTMLDLGRSEKTVAKKFKQPVTQVVAKARVTKAPEGVQKKYAYGQLSIDALIELQKCEDAGDAEVTAEVHDNIERVGWKVDRDGMIRMISRARHDAAEKREVEKLASVGAKEVPPQAVYDGKHQLVEDELTPDEHVAAGHQFRVMPGREDPSTPRTEWYVKADAPKQAPSEEERAAEKQRKEMLRALRQQLPISAEVRHRHYVDHVQDRKAGDPATDMDMLRRLLERELYSVPEEILVGVTGISKGFEGDRWDHPKKWNAWRDRLEKKIRSFTWQQLVRLATLGKYWDAAERPLVKPEGWQIRGERAHLRSAWQANVSVWFGHEWDSVEQQALGMCEPEPAAAGAGGEPEADEELDDDAA